MSRVIRVARAWGPVVEGAALVMKEGFSPRYDLNRVTGVITRIGHSCEGQSVKDKVLVIPTTGKLNPVMVQGAVLAGLPIAEGGVEDGLLSIESGARVRIDPARTLLTVL